MCASQKILTDCVFIIMTFRRCPQHLLNVPNFIHPFLENPFINLLNYFILVSNRYGLGFLQGSSS